nr:ABC transporter ATP-binding protein [Paenibacillus xylanexedens]
MNISNTLVIKNIWKLFKPYSATFFIMTLGMFFSALLTTINPIIFGVLIDQVFYNENVNILPTFLLIFFILFIGENIFRFNEYKLWMLHYTTFMFDIKKLLLNKLLRLKAKILNKSEKGDMISVVMYDSDEIYYLINWFFNEFLFHFIRFSFYFAWVALINIHIALILFIYAPITVMLSKKVSNIIEKQATETRKEYGVFISWLIEFANGMREVKLLSAEKYVLAQFLKKYRRMMWLSIKKIKIDFIGDRVDALIQVASTITLFSVCAVFLNNNQITIGEFIAINAYFGSTNWELRELTKGRKEMSWRLAKIKKTLGLLNHEIESAGPTSIESSYNKGSASIEFKDVTFGYNEKSLVLNRLNLVIQEGETIAIVGESGSGKSTITGLLLKLYDEYSGEIYINGINIRDKSNESIRNSIGIVMQDFAFFDNTIRYNLTLGNDIPEDEIWDACRRAHIDEVIKSQPLGLDTEMGSSLSDLSGGQKQRIAIARTLIKKPEIIILDEATASLDNETEKHINKEIHEYFKDKTTIIITHRTSGLVYVDKIAYLKDGEITIIDDYSVVNNVDKGVGL